MTRLEIFIQNIKDKLNDDTVKFLSGDVSLDKNEQKRRIIFVRNEFVFKAPERNGRVTLDDARTAKRIFSVTERVDVYLFANNNEELEELMVEFILAIRTLLGTDASASGGQWLIEENGKGGFSSRTPAIRIPIEFPWSLVDQPQQNVTPTGFNNGTKLNGELPD